MSSGSTSSQPSPTSRWVSPFRTCSTRGSKARPSSCSSSGSCRRLSGGCSELGGPRPRALCDPAPPRPARGIHPPADRLVLAGHVHEVVRIRDRRSLHRAQGGQPVQFHRGWPGVGFTHSLAFGLAVALAILLITRSHIWAFSFLLGNWAHVLTDVGDTIGAMLLFPFSTETFGIGA